MSDNKKSPDNNDISPIRGLFRQNEEAYNKHQQKVKEEKEYLAKKRQEQEKMHDNERNKPLPTIEKVPKDSGVSFGGRMKTFFGKIAEIVTQPEDGSFFGEEDGFEDIYSDEQPEIQNITAEKSEEISEEALVYDEPSESDDGISDIVEAVIYQSTDNEPDSDVHNDKSNEETDDNIEKENEPELEIETSKDANADNAENKAKQPEVKTEITLDAIMYAKNAGAEGTPVTYAANKQNESTAEDVKLTESDIQKSAELPDEAKKEEANENIYEQKNELSHSISKDQEDTLEKESVNELSHSISKDQEDTREKKSVNELSHNKAAEDTTDTDRKRVNELSHEFDSEVKSETARKPKNELSHSVEKIEREITDVKPSEISTKEPKKANLSEGIRESMVYRRSDSPPFIVMAGKFTKTLRSEYESTRRLRGYTPETNNKENDKPDTRKSEFSKPEQKNTNSSEKIKKMEKSSEVNENTDSDSNILKMPEIKKKNKFRIRDLFSADGDTFDEEEDTAEEKTEITDYQNKDDVAAIKNEINYNFSKRLFRTVLLMCIAIGSAIVSLLAQLVPSLFMEAIHNGWLVFGIINFILLAIAVFTEKTTIFYGLVPLRHFKATSDTAVSVASVAAVIQSVIGLFLPDIFVNGTYHMYSFLVIIALLFNSIGKLIIIKRTADNFRFLCSPKAKYAGKIYTDKNNAPKLISGLAAQRPIIAYTKKSKLMSNFLQLSYASDPIEDNSSFIAPFAAILSLICGLTYGFLSKDFVGGVSSFALTSFITIPICALITLNIPIKNLCTSTLRKGSMVVGYEAVKQFSDTNAIMIESNRLYPKGNIILSGIKTFNESKLNTALLAGAAVNFAVDGPMSHIFETIIQDRKHMVPAVESVSYDDNLGLSGWIGGQRILIGNRELMNKHNISIPDENVELKYRKMGNEISYISMSGELIAMFILTYKVDRDIAASLRELTQNGVNIIVRTIDPNITQRHIADKFGIYQRCIKVLNTGLGNICHDEINSIDETSRAYVVTDGKLSAFAAAVSGCIEIKSTVTISKAVQIASIILGFLLVNIISFVGGFAKLGGLEVLIYTFVWCIGLIIVSILARKFNG